MIERPELKILREQGIEFHDPFEIVSLFEKTVADFAGAHFGIATDSATHAIELCLRYLAPEKRTLIVPRNTYPSVPMTVRKLGHSLQWSDEQWAGAYRISPLPVVDASVRFTEGMYQQGTFFCLSFQNKKHLPIGRGGMILTDDPEAHAWLQKASYDGRIRGVPWREQKIEMMGYHYYMTPEDAARGLLLFQDLPKHNPDRGSWRDYPDLSQFPCFR